MDDRAFDVSNKTILVTGGASGIGLAVARRFLTFGARVAVADLSTNPQLAEEGALFVQTDVRDAENVANAFDAIVDRIGKLDVIVNNAGIAPDTGRMDDMDLGAAAQTFDVNLKGVMHGLIYGPPRMNDGGSIINMSSVSGSMGLPGYGPYAASKAGVEGLTRVSAVELGPRAIRVNAICPGTITTPLEPETSTESVLSRILTPMGRIGQPEDLVGLFHFLAADESRYITGQCIYVDGGITAGFPEVMIDRLTREPS